MDNSEVEKSKALITVELIEYIPNSVVIKTILKKTTGSVTVMSVDDGEGLAERTSAFDTYAQIIDGQAELIIGGKKFILFTGESIVIPAHVSSFVSPNHRFKMILTVIKSGYDV